MDIPTEESQADLRQRLTRAVGTAPTPWPLRPRRIEDWLAQYQGKTFVGTVTADRFKLILLGNTGPGMRWHGGGAVLTGTLEDRAVHARVRPPYFVSIILSMWCLVALTGLVLSFYGPSNTPLIHLLLLGMLGLPPAIFTLTFSLESRRAYRELCRVITPENPMP